MNTQLRIDRARWFLLTENPFYGSLSMSLTDIIDSFISTAATDGKVIRWNPTFVESLTDEELRFVLAHETLHCAHQHLWRLPADERGNKAGDYEINLTLQAIDGIKMPEGGLLDTQYREMACEEILGRLPEEDDASDDSDGEGGDGQPQPGGQSSSSDNGAGQPSSDPCGAFTEPSVDADAGESPESLRDDWEGRVMQAAQAAQALGRGDIPGDMQRILDRIRHQGIDWRREMADFVKDAMSTRNDWSRSSRRHAWQSVIYPRKRADEAGRVVFARDTSGSVSDKQLSVYSGLITDCLAETGCSGLVLDADRIIQDEIELAPGDECPLAAKGGGGTDFRPVFNRVDELVAMGEHVAGIVYITDLGGPAPESSDIPTLWLVTNSQPAPFGRAVEIEGVN